MNTLKLSQRRWCGPNKCADIVLFTGFVYFVAFSTSVFLFMFLSMWYIIIFIYRAGHLKSMQIQKQRNF
jgi:hypothetical protein